MRGRIAMILFVVSALSGCLSDFGGSVHDGSDTVAMGYESHVIVGISDSGINPYHEVYFRPDRTEHPCTYIKSVPCDIPSLNLTLDPELTYDEALAADQQTWAEVQEKTWYWIPQTVFIGVACETLRDNPDAEPICILDDVGSHGTYTTSSVLSENPDAMLVFSESTGSTWLLRDSPFPIDIISQSYGPPVPVPVVGTCQEFLADEGNRGLHEDSPLGFEGWFGASAVFIKAAGNIPYSTTTDCSSGNPHVISVGGAQIHDGNREHSLAAKQSDVVSYFCRPTAAIETRNGTSTSSCGTSFAAPTVAGALSWVVLEDRRASGYTGGANGTVLNPVTGLTTSSLRDAMNWTASYDPESRYEYTPRDDLDECPSTIHCYDTITQIPRNDEAPWLQWSWGFYDRGVAQATLDYLRGEPNEPKSNEAVLYMEAVYTARQTAYG